jgi:hypothetical protein
MTTKLLHIQQIVLPRLRQLGVREVAGRTGLSLVAVSAVLAGEAEARASSRARYHSVAR